MKRDIKRLLVFPPVRLEHIMSRLFRLTAIFAILAAAACSNVGVDD